MTQVPPDPGWPPRADRPWDATPPTSDGWSTARVVALAFGGAVVLLALLGVAVFASLGPAMSGVLLGDGPPRRDADGQVVEPALVEKDDLQSGDCLDDHALLRLEPGGELDAPSDFAEVVPCRGSHDFEVSGTFLLPEKEYADQKALQRAAQRGCFRQSRRDWAEDRRLLRDKMLAFYMPPFDDARQDRVVCLLQLASGERMTGSIR